MVFLFSTGAAIAGIFMVFIADGFDQILQAIETTLKYQLGGVGAYLGSNVINDFAYRNNPTDEPG
jgi:hypothetical protein